MTCILSKGTVVDVVPPVDASWGTECVRYSELDAEVTRSRGLLAMSLDEELNHPRYTNHRNKELHEMEPKTLAERLRDLGGRATARPWSADTSNPDDVVVWGRPGEDDFLANVACGIPQESSVLYDMTAANAELAVELVNNLDKIVRALEAYDGE